MSIKALAVCVGTIVILFTYDWRLALIIVAVVIPQILAQRVSSHYLKAFTTRYQKVKSEMSNFGAEQITNIRNVKAFADEDMASLRFALKNQEVFQYGRAQSYIRCLFFLS